MTAALPRTRRRARTPETLPGRPEPDQGGLDARLFVNSVEKGMVILELFETARHGLSLTDIAARTNMGHSAAQRFVYSLHHLGYLSRDADTKRYALGPKVLRLYSGFIGGRSALDRARPALVELSGTTQETTSWVELLDHEVVVIESLRSPHITSVTLAPGMRFEALSASSGQVLLAHATPEDAARVLAASSTSAQQRAGVGDLAGLYRLLDRVRGQGYALTTKAFDVDSISISAPVLDAQGRAVGAVNLSTLCSRFDKADAVAKLVPALLIAARKAGA